MRVVVDGCSDPQSEACAIAIVHQQTGVGEKKFLRGIQVLCMPCFYLHTIHPGSIRHPRGGIMRTC